MALPACSEQEFIELFKRFQSPEKVARHLGIAVANVRRRRRKLEKKHRLLLPVNDPRPAYNTAMQPARHDPPLVHIGIEDGCILVFGDAHYYPSYEPWTCHRALIKLAREWKPKYIIANGDIFDFPGISRHHRIGWEAHPTVKQELECVQERLSEIQEASKNSKFIRVWGNHDLRFEGKLSNILPQYEGVNGMALSDHIPHWKACWAVRVNKEELGISHRWKGGIHSPHNNTKDAGISYCTGHDHFPRVDPWADVRGLRYGINHGTLADFLEEDGSMTEPFMYTEQKPTHWWSAFAKLTFKGGKLLEPQLIRKVDANTVQFAGETFPV